MSRHRPLRKATSSQHLDSDDKFPQNRGHTSSFSHPLRSRLKDGKRYPYVDFLNSPNCSALRRQKKGYRRRTKQKRTRRIVDSNSIWNEVAGCAIFCHALRAGRNTLGHFERVAFNWIKIKWIIVLRKGSSEEGSSRGEFLFLHHNPHSTMRSSKN